MRATPPQPLPRVPKSEEIITTTRRLNAERRAIIDEIVKKIDPAYATFANVIKPLAELNNAQSGERSVIAALRTAAPEVTTQRAVEDASNLPREEQGDINSRLDFYELVKAVDDRHKVLDEEDRKMLSVTLLRFARHGQGNNLQHDDQGLLENEQEIQNICSQFNRNIRQHGASSKIGESRMVRNTDSVSSWADGGARYDGKRPIS